MQPGFLLPCTFTCCFSLFAKVAGSVCILCQHSAMAEVIPCLNQGLPEGSTKGKSILWCCMPQFKGALQHCVCVCEISSAPGTD